MTRVFAQVFRARRLRLLCLSGLVLAVAASCSKTEDTQAYVPSEQGAVQPDAGGVLLSEASACSALKAAESRARDALGCPALTRECPGYIRPAGGADCFQYSQDSVTGCESLYESFSACEDFDRHPCLIAAISNCDAPDAGEGGAGGQPSITPEAGSSGAGEETAAGAGGA